MGVLSGGCEIVELTEQDDDSESKISANPGKQHVGETLKKYSLGDDINKLFDAIEIRSSHRVVGKPGRGLKGDFSKSAMKRPMAFGPSQVAGIGFSESVSLKQALRGLCVSQASEMAAVKKRMSRLSASPGISEVVATKRLYKENLVEILLIPEKSSSEFSVKGSEPEASKLSEIKTELGVPPLQSSVGFELSVSGKEHNKKLELVHSSVSAAFIEKLPVLDEVCPETDENSVTEDGQGKQRLDELQPASSNFDLERKPYKTPKLGFGSSKPSLITQNILKKKIMQKTSAMKSRSQQKKLPSGDTPTELICQTPGCIKECEELEKVSPASSSNADLAASSVSKDNDMTNSRGKSVTSKCDERSRSKERGEFSQSSKSSMGEYSSTTTSHSEESYTSGSNRNGCRPHMSRDLRWEAISCVRNQQGILGMRHFKLLRKVGGGDIGTVYLSELIGTSCLFAVKVMNNDLLVSKKKLLRAQTEKEILEILDHPFLPTLYAHFATSKFTCLVMEYCPGGDLHVLRQRQPTNSFSEHAARFYIAEVLLALEYLHMLGVVYRDLKPENILVREDGHIMLTDFDLSFRCSANPTFVKSSSSPSEPPEKTSSPCFDPSCIEPFCLQPSWNLPCFSPSFLSTDTKTRKLKSELASQIIPLPQLVVEPVNARSNSFVGTHEYLAPEIIKGEGHGSAVDWWTLGIFLYELLYGKTPFKGSSNEDTVSNVVSQGLKFPECPMVSSHARDLIRRLLTKEPENRLGYVKGAVEIKEHPFFDRLNFALIRCETPPEVPRFFDLANVIPDITCPEKTNKGVMELECRGKGIEFEMF